MVITGSVPNALLVMDLPIIAQHVLGQLQPNALHAILVFFFIQILAVSVATLARTGIGETHQQINESLAMVVA